MMFKNTIKLLMSNFSMVWKLLAYKLIVIAIVAGLFCAGLGYLNNIPEFTDFSNSLISFLSTASFVSTPNTILTNAFEVLSSFFALVVAVFTIYPVLLAYYLFIFVVILPYLWHLSDIAVTENLFGFMSSLTKYGFMSSLIRNLSSANTYSWCFTLLILPVNILFFGGIIGLIYLTTFGGIVAYITPCLILIFTLIYFALRTTLLSNWASAISTTNCGVIKGFARGISAVSRRFFRTLSNAIVLNFAFMALIMITGFFGLVVLISLFCYINSILGMVVYFESQGMRYYVDFDKIITPKKLEQTEKMKKLKFIV